MRAVKKLASVMVKIVPVRVFRTPVVLVVYKTLFVLLVYLQTTWRMKRITVKRRSVGICRLFVSVHQLVACFLLIRRMLALLILYRLDLP